MDDASGIADSCKEFADFLTVSQKYRYHCVYVLHIIIPQTEIWEKIILQTNIFNIFLCSIPYNTVTKILQNNCAQKTTKYVPLHSMCLNRVFIDLAKEDQTSCLIIDCSNVNRNGPGRYRTNADNPEEHVCYFDKASNDQVYNTFMSKQIKSGNFEKGIYFKIDRVQSKIDKETFSANKTLEKNGSGNDRLSKRNREQTDSADGQGGESRYGKATKNIQYVRESARSRFLSGR